MVKDMWLVPGYKDTGEVDTVTLGSQGGDINGALYGSGQIDSCYEREDGAGNGSVDARDACASKRNLVRANLYLSTIYADKTISFYTLRTI